MSKSNPFLRRLLGFAPTLALAAFAAATFGGCDSSVDPVALPGDHASPRVFQTNPDGGAESISTKAMITVTFSEPMDAATFHFATFEIRTNDVPVPGTIVGLGRRFTFDPLADLPVGVVEVSIHGVADLSGNQLAAPYLFSFETSITAPPPPPEPVNPSPASSATGVDVDGITFTWEPDSGANVTYDFLLGLSADNLSKQASGLTTESFQPGVLSYSTTYWWQVIARRDGSETPGQVWTFTTKAPPPPPNRPPGAPAPPITPADRAISIAIDVDLTWSGGNDPDGDPVTYDVRFGTQNPPPFLITVTAKTHRVEDLDYQTRYFWQIVARDDHDHDVAGPVWRFDTGLPANRPPTAPCSPDPADGVQNVPVTIALTWGCGDDPDGDEVTYSVYLERGDDTPDDLAAVVSEKSYVASSLDSDATYYWRIEANDGRDGIGTGPVWSFTTVTSNPPPSAPCSPNPENGALLVDTTVELTWSCGDDPDVPVVFDIYLGNTPDPPRIEENWTERRYPTGLDNFTTYYWRIVARDHLGGERSGPVWSFTTEPIAQ